MTSLNEESIRQALAGDMLVGREVRVLPEVGSTNDYLKEAARGGAPEGDPPLKLWAPSRSFGERRRKAEGRGAPGGGTAPETERKSPFRRGENPGSTSFFKQKLSQTIIENICELSNDIDRE